MAYTPTQADFNAVVPATSGYTPTQADFDDVSLPAQPLISGHHLWESARQLAGMPLDILTGIAQGTHDLLVPGMRSVTEGLPLPKEYQETMQSPSISRPPSLREAAGLPETPIGNVLHSLAKWVPTQALGDATIPAKLATAIPEAMAKMGLLSGMYSGSQGGNPLTGTAIGATVGAVIPGASKLTGYLARKIGQTAAPHIIEKMFTQADAHGLKQDALENIQDNYQGALAHYNDLAADAGQSAKKLDAGIQEPGVMDDIMKPYYAYDPTSYKRGINAIAQDLKEEGISPEGEQQIEHWQTNLPRSFTQAIKKRRNINKINIPNPATQTYSNMVNRVGDLRNSLIQNAEENAAKQSWTPEGQNFINSWRAANQQYSHNVAPFESTPDSTGRLVPNRNLSGVWKENANPSTKIIDNFAGGKNPEANAAHFHNLVGDTPKAQQALRASHFSANYDKQGIPTKSFLQKYARLSPSMRNSMFNPDEQETLNRVISTFVAPPKRSGLGGYFVPVELGARTAEALGGNWTSGALAGLMAKTMIAPAAAAPFTQASGSGLRALAAVEPRLAKLNPYFTSLLAPHVLPTSQRWW